MQLRGGYTTDDPRLDRLPQFDDRSRNYPAVRGTPIEAAPIRNMTWPIRDRAVLNQGNQGRCVEFAICHELLSYPAEVPWQLVKAILDGLLIYCPAQRNDPWEGEAAYCDNASRPHYEGTSVLAGVAQAVALGAAVEYRWMFGLDEVLRGMSWRGPVMFGLNWYEGMMRPDADGFIEPTGRVVGGHMILGNRIRTTGEYVEFVQSWGPGHGPLNGYVRIRWDHLDRLLQEAGEAVMFTSRSTVPDGLAS